MKWGNVLTRRKVDIFNRLTFCQFVDNNSMVGTLLSLRSLGNFRFPPPPFSILIIFKTNKFGFYVVLVLLFYADFQQEKKKMYTILQF